MPDYARVCRVRLSVSYAGKAGRKAGEKTAASKQMSDCFCLPQVQLVNMAGNTENRMKYPLPS